MKAQLVCYVGLQQRSLASSCQGSFQPGPQAATLLGRFRKHCRCPLGTSQRILQCLCYLGNAPRQTCAPASTLDLEHLIART